MSSGLSTNSMYNREMQQVDNNLVVGVDLGGTNVRAAVVDCSTGEIVGRSNNISSCAMEGVESTCAQILCAIRDAISQTPFKLQDMSAIGIAVPGHILTDAGLVLSAPNFKDQWKNVHLAAPIEEALDVPVYLGNDANMAALGEHQFGIGRGTLNMIMITMGTGIGGGLILNGKLFLGSDGGAGEIGYMTINAGGRGGNSSFGSVEGETQADAIVERAARKIQAGRQTILAEKTGYDRFKLTPAMIAEAAQAGDATSIEVFQETGHYVGLCVANIVNLLNPEMVVIGGGISLARELLLGPVLHVAAACIPGSIMKNCRIVISQLGDNAGIMGAAALGAQESLNRPLATT